VIRINIVCLFQPREALGTEFWDIIDKDGNFIRRTPVLGTVTLDRGEYHLVAHIWIKNSKGEFLIQHRAEHMDMMPGLWAANGGSVKSGETSAQAAARELHEELGLKTAPEQLQYRERLVRRNSLADIWLLRADVDIRGLTLQSDEVTEVKWVAPAGLRFMVAQGVFHDYGKAYFDIVFSL